MWNILTEHYDFGGKTVLDFGCGYGDMLVNLYLAGAKYIHGYENNIDVFRIAHDKVKGFPTVRLHFSDFEENGWLYPRSDAAFCFSVLPYLKRPTVFLEELSTAVETTFIECQYAEDGPGFDAIRNDDDMRIYLSHNWTEIEAIGKTHVEGRDKWRTIWMCR